MISQDKNKTALPKIDEYPLNEKVLAKYGIIYSRNCEDTGENGITLLPRESSSTMDNIETV